MPQTTQYYPPRTRRVSRRTQRALLRGLAWFIAMIIREALA